MPTHGPIGANTASNGTSSAAARHASAKPMPRRAPSASSRAPGTNAIHHSIHASTCRRLPVASVSASSGASPCAANASADNCTSTTPIRASQPASAQSVRRRTPAHTSAAPGSTNASRL